MTTTDETKTNEDLPKDSLVKGVRDWFGWRVILFGMFITSKDFQSTVKEMLALGMASKIKSIMGETSFDDLLDAIKDIEDVDQTEES